MKLIDLLNCLYYGVTVSITTNSDEWNNKVYTSVTKISDLPQDLINLIKNRKVKNVYTLNDIIRIEIEK